MTRISVIIPTRNRPAKIAETVAALQQQSVAPSEYEIIVVDDGSTTPVNVPAAMVVRTEGVERSAARNAGAAHAMGELLLFLDDDMTVGHDFVANHLAAHREWPGVLVVGRITLEKRPTQGFIRFRQDLESSNMPAARGFVDQPNFCAANASIAREGFARIGGYDPNLVSAEDQDLAMRHVARGGRIVYLPEAEAVHRDDADTLRSYVERQEWGTEKLMPFLMRYPQLSDNVDRLRVNGPVAFGREPLRQSLLKMMKSAAAWAPLRELVFALTATVERVAPESALVNRLYRLVLGIHIRRGFMRGWKHRNSGGSMIGLAGAS